jgi:hypothetical protein
MQGSNYYATISAAVRAWLSFMGKLDNSYGNYHGSLSSSSSVTEHMSGTGSGCCPLIVSGMA